jgi:hypothetical protein
LFLFHLQFEHNWNWQEGREKLENGVDDACREQECAPIDASCTGWERIRPVRIDWGTGKNQSEYVGDEESDGYGDVGM